MMWMRLSFGKKVTLVAWTFHYSSWQAASGRLFVNDTAMWHMQARESKHKQSN
jgi:hypothetical protein